MEGFVRFLHEKIPIGTLALFRILFGGIMLWEAYRYLSKGWVKRYFIEPEFYFTYFPFDWVAPWPGSLMYVHFAVMGLLAFCIMLGLFYRLTMPLFFLCFSYIFLLDKSNYLNHFYLIILISFIMIWVPANRYWSLDALIWPSIRREQVGRWALLWLKLQLGFAYFFGGIAKLNGDWLRCEPMRAWLQERTDFPVIGGYFEYEAAAWLFSYGGLLIDLFALPLLLWKRSRMFMFTFLAMFHLMNSQMFVIGIFPWFMLGASLIYFRPDWPQLLWARIWGMAVPTFPKDTYVKRQNGLMGLITVYIIIQLFLPFRHHFFSGNVSWTEEGHRFSWRMKLRSKTGGIRFRVHLPETGAKYSIRLEDLLSRRQIRKMRSRPDMILQFAHYIAKRFRDKGYQQVEVRVEAKASLNGRKLQYLIDPQADLDKKERAFFQSADWIVPLTEPLVVKRGK